MTATSLRRRVERMEKAMNAASDVRLVDIICAAQELAERRARGEIIPEPTPWTEAELADAERRGGLLSAFAAIERRRRANSAAVGQLNRGQPIRGEAASSRVSTRSMIRERTHSALAKLDPAKAPGSQVALHRITGNSVKVDSA